MQPTKRNRVAEYSCGELVRAGIWAVRRVLSQIETDVSTDPEAAFTKVEIGTPPKRALRVDIGAEDTFARSLHKYNQKRYWNINVFGEERLRNTSLDLTRRPGVCVLVDALDGTDLLERGLGNWCSAAVFFCPSHPPGQRILAAVVGLASSEIYFAAADDPIVRVQTRDGTEREVHGPSKLTKLSDATVCYYGQKISNFLSIFRAGFPEQAELITNGRKKPNFRIYNLAGIPLMLRLIDRQISGMSGIDVVLDVEGQKPHDVVPGAFIAVKAGAVLKDSRTGEAITLEQLEDSLLRPASPDFELRYVLAATAKLCRATIECLR